MLKLKSSLLGIFSLSSLFFVWTALIVLENKYILNPPPPSFRNTLQQPIEIISNIGNQEYFWPENVLVHAILVLVKYPKHHKRFRFNTHFGHHHRSEKTVDIFPFLMGQEQNKTLANGTDPCKPRPSRRSVHPLPDCSSFWLSQQDFVDEPIWADRHPALS